jgi:hypothetical protein
LGEAKKASGSIAWLNNRIAKSCALAGLHEVTNDRIMVALETYDLFTDAQLAVYRSELTPDPSDARQKRDAARIAHFR